MQKGIQTRYIVHELLKILKNNNVSFDEVFNKKIRENNFSLSDSKMIHNIVLTSMRYQLYVNEVLKKFTQTLDKKSDAYFLLLSASTQLIILKFKDFAVINSTVELTKHKKIKAPKKFINGVLRNINRSKKKLLEIKYNFSQLPSWFTKRNPLWNKKDQENFMKTIREEPDLHLVFKNKKDTTKFSTKYIQTTDHSVAIKNSILIKNIEGFKEGLWWVQDFAAMLPLYLLTNLKNKKVVDLCAAPGGKTFQLINNKASVTAIDKNKTRIQLMRKNLNRLKIDCELSIIDVFKINNKKFDIVILDAPCTSIGTIRRHPEILYRRSSPNFSKILTNQEKLLEKGKTLLKKNGILIYMVCSFLEEEGWFQINKFLEKNKNLSLDKFSHKGIKNIKHLISKKGFYYVVPSRLQNKVLIDGFFAAKIKKND